MSYGTVYKIGWIDYFDQVHEVLIQQRDTAESITEVPAAGNPFSITYETPSDNINEPINGSFATIRLVTQTDFQFIDLYTSDNRKYQVIHTVDAVTNWKGFILPDQYQEQYKGPPYVNEFIAADQLGYLRTLAWDQETEIVSYLDLLDIILGATGLEIDLYEALNVYENDHNSTTADSPLDQTYLNANVYEGHTYYEALFDILQNFTAIIKQDRGKWFIYRPTKAIASFQRRLWTWSAGYSYDSTALYDPIVSTTSATPETAKADLVRISAQATMFINQAWRNYTINQSLRKKLTVVRNGFFTAWTSGSPDYWIKTGGAAPIQSGNSARFNAITSFSSLIHMSQSVIPFESDRLEVSVNWEIYIRPGATMDVYFALQQSYIAGGTVNSYDFNNDTWTIAGKRYKRTYDNSTGSSAVIQGDSIKIVTNRTGLVSIDSMLLSIFHPVSANTNCYVKFNNYNIRIMEDLTATSTQEHESDRTFPVTIDPRNNFSPSDIDVLCSDVPIGSSAYRDAENIYLGALFSDNLKQDQTKSWTDDLEIGTLIELMQSSISELYLSPQQVLSVTIYSKLLFSSSIIQEVNNSNRLFMIKRATWDCKFGRWTVEAWEIGQDAGAALKAEDDQDLLAEDGSTLLT